MTIEEAIENLELMKRIYNHIRKMDNEWEAIEMAISALRAQRDKNEIVDNWEPIRWLDKDW